MSEEEEGGKTFIDTSMRDKKPTTVDQPEGKKRDGLYIVIIILLLLGGGYMGYVLSEKNKDLNQCTNDRQAIENEMADLNDMMYDQGLDRGEDVKKNLENMLTMYERMEGDNQAMNDSIAIQRDKIKTLMEDLEKSKGDKRHYMSKVYKLEKETETLRSIMKDYIRTIDSLNTANGVLTENLNMTLADLEKMTESRNSFQNEAEELGDKVNKGSKLNAFGFLTEGIREKGSGAYKENNRASRCTHIRSCFTLGDNAIASAGNKTVYMRVITPGGSVLSSSNSNTLKTESGQSLLYSDKKLVNYQNKAVDLCIFHELSVELEGGNYLAEIYCEGVKIGSDSFVLK
ncbi:hypothetical protein [Crocinitomix algicola]|uniref:hypothetical protein n=1 Tax=Crocinitomix algicola TaxID=1740263 RepID=UPI000835B3A3|nr:hypothetical protein [Crocinitomix algicola]